MDLQKIEALLALLGDHEVSEFEFQDAEVRLRFKLGRTVERVADPTPMMREAPAAVPVPSAAASAASPLADPRVVAVESPMVGTFYRAPTPGSPSFIDVGSVIQPGQVVCIVEAMKLMNEIESEVAGTVVEVLVENGHPVQFGQPLFRVRRG